MTTVQFTLPDALAQEAARAGLLSPSKLEQWLRDQLASRSSNAFFDAMQRMSAVDEPAPMSAEEVAIEIEAMRAQRRAGGNAY